MRRALFLPLAVLLSLFAFTAGAGSQQQPVQNTLPNTGDYVAAGPHCQRRVRLSPIVTTPAVNWPKTYQCVLTIHTCRGVQTYRSAERPGGTTMCDDYRSVHDAFAGREICCDQESRDQRPPPLKQPQEPEGGDGA